MNNNSVQQEKFIYSEIAQKAIEIGRQKHWRFRVVGHGELPQRPFYRGAWWFEPVKELPKGKERLDALNISGINFKGFMVAHEVTLVETKSEPDFKIQTPDILPAMDNVLKVAGQVVFSLLYLVVQAALIDPALIVVLDDGAWLEIMNYYE